MPMLLRSPLPMARWLIVFSLLTLLAGCATKPRKEEAPNPWKIPPTTKLLAHQASNDNGALGRSRLYPCQESA